MGTKINDFQNNNGNTDPFWRGPYVNPVQNGRFTPSVDPCEVAKLQKEFIELAEKLAKLTLYDNMHPFTMPCTTNEVKVTIVNGQYEIHAKLQPVKTGCATSQYNPSSYQHLYGADNAEIEPSKTSWWPKVVFFAVREFMVYNQLIKRDNVDSTASIIVPIQFVTTVSDNLQTFITSNHIIHRLATAASIGNITDIQEVVEQFIRTVYKRRFFPVLNNRHNLVTMEHNGITVPIQHYTGSRSSIPLDPAAMKDYELYRFENKDRLWIWGNPKMLIIDIFDIEPEDVDRLAIHNTYFDFLEEHLVDAVMEFNRTTEEVDQEIEQKFEEDSFATHPSYSALISHFKHMFADEIAARAKQK